MIRYSQTKLPYFIISNIRARAHMIMHARAIKLIRHEGFSFWPTHGGSKVQKYRIVTYLIAKVKGS